VYWDGGDPALRDALAAGHLEWVASAEAADVVVGAAPSAPAASGDLTDREAEVLAYLADGWSNDEIADRLGIGVRTVRFHLDRLYRKLGVNRRTEAVREAVSRGYFRF
jgi:DNA-binding CsgD family transcriptional regulator